MKIGLCGQFSLFSLSFLVSGCADEATTKEPSAAPAAAAAPEAADPAAPAVPEAADPDASAKPPIEEPASTGPSEDAYRAQAEALVAAIDGGTAAEEILALSDALTTTGMAMIPDLISSHPECKEYLDAIVAVGSTLKDLPIAEIEAGYHMDGKLPTMPSADCYHGKDLVVHPATVSAQAKAGLPTKEAREEAKGEIVEVLAHLKAIEPKTAE